MERALTVGVSPVLVSTLFSCHSLTQVVGMLQEVMAEMKFDKVQHGVCIE